jgi:hypothetical protein
MAVHRERVDPIRMPDGSLLVHRRWLLPDQQARTIELQRLTRLWRGLAEADLLEPNREVSLLRLELPWREGAEPEESSLPMAASAGALLAAGGRAALLTQVVWLASDERRDPYAEPDDGVHGFRDYTLYAIAHERFRLLPIRPTELRCARCGHREESGPFGPAWAPVRFGEGFLFDLESKCSGCGAVRDPGRDTATLRTGARFLLEEAICRTALSIELPAPPEAEELPDARTADLVRAAFGEYDELADDKVPAAT